MKIIPKSTIGELVATDYRLAPVFKAANIDFCCNGNRSIQEACETKKLNTKELINKLQEVVHSNSSNQTDVADWPLDLLADYIQKKHHRYVEGKLPEIKEYLTKIVNVHVKSHPELLKIQTLFNQSADELTVHMKKEELIIFPYIRSLVTSPHKLADRQQSFKSLKYPIRVMMEDHNSEGERFRSIAKLSNNYQVPDNVCNTYKVCFKLLQEFEEDLHRHIHLENNILFPKAILLEEELTHQNKTQ